MSPPSCGYICNVLTVPLHAWTYVTRKKKYSSQVGLSKMGHVRSSCPTHTHTHKVGEFCVCWRSGGGAGGHIIRGSGKSFFLWWWWLGRVKTKFLDFLQTFTNINRHMLYLYIDFRITTKIPQKCARLWLGSVSVCVVNLCLFCVGERFIWV